MKTIRHRGTTHFPRLVSIGTMLSLLAFSFGGCSSSVNVSTDDSVTRQSETGAISPPTFEVEAVKLLEARLPFEETSQGWVRLFDEQTLFGWEITSQTNWRVEDKSIVVDSGEPGLLCTSVAWADFELRFEYKAPVETNSGIFLRTPLEPSDPALDCYEINIAPPSNPFPTGSVVKRKKVEAGQPGSEQSPLDPEQWHLYEIKLLGGEMTLKVDGAEVCKYSDAMPLPPGRIGLQHNSGPVAFRDIRIRPLGFKALLDKDLSQWKRYPDKPGDFVVNEDGDLRVTGGRGQIESLGSYGDFAALIEAKTQSEKLNSGIFFRCIPGEDMNGYECQINHGIKDANPLAPVDCGTGGIFRREDARIVAANDREWFSMLMVADGLQMAAWVNGLQVTDWKDTRPANPNPRNGSRVAPGTIMLQAHDPTTDILFRKVDVVPLRVAAP